MTDQNLTPDPRQDDQADTTGTNTANGAMPQGSAQPAAQNVQNQMPAGQETSPTTPIQTSGAFGQDDQQTHVQSPVSSSSSSDDDFLTTRFDVDQEPASGQDTQSWQSGTGYTPAEGYGANPTGAQNAPQNGEGQNAQNSGDQPTQNLNPGQNGQNTYGGYGSGYGAYGTNTGYGTGATGYGAQGANNGNPGAYGTSNNHGYGAPNAGANGPVGGNGANGGNGAGWSGTGWNNAGFNNNGNNAKAKKKPMSQTARTWVASIVSALIAALIVLGIGWGGIASGLITVPSSSSLSSLNSSGSGSGSAKVPSGKSVDWQALNKKVAASVVSIQAEVSNGVAAGSGAILDKSGNIVTNNHVVEGASQIQVTLSNGNIYTAKLVGVDTTTDLAVIRLQNPPSNLTPVTFADSSSLAVGEQIMSIGNPLGYENTATTGIISALNRPVTVSDESTNSEIVTNAVQIDAAINPGNSGGPTFNAAGQVIGINSSIATASSSSSSSSSSGSIGIGFAIPSNLVKRVANAIIKDGHVDHAKLGVTIRTGSAEANGATRAGAQVVTVTSGSAGAKAGLQKGDVIVGFNGNTVSGMYSLLGYVRAAAVGDTVKLTVIRDGKVLDLNCTLSDVESRSSSSSSNGNSNKNNSGNGQGQQGQGNGNSRGNGSDDDDSDDDSSDGGLTDPFGWF